MSRRVERDERFMRRALRLAERGRYRVSPNPMVGAVVVRRGRVVGEGWHREVGGPHAEIEAFAAAGEKARGAELFVTLEPCSHFGRTPPCVEAVRAAGVRRVVICHRDPNPLVSGRGIGQLAEAGVEVVEGVLAERGVALNTSFLTHQIEERPHVTLKWAMTLDGKIATRTGNSQWISSPAGRRWALLLREEHDAILVGSGTVAADDPSLNRRQGKAVGPILRVVMDRRLRTPPEAKLLTVAGPVVLYTRHRASKRREEALREAGAEVVRLDRVTPETVVRDLAARGVASLLVEGGGEIHGAFLEEELFDAVKICCAPLLVGGAEAPGPVRGKGVTSLTSAARLEGLTTRRRGVDVLLEGRRKGCLQALLSSVVGS